MRIVRFFVLLVAITICGFTYNVLIKANSPWLGQGGRAESTFDWQPTSGGSGESDGPLDVLPGMECLVGEDGLRIKALVAQPGLRCIDKIAGGNAVGPNLDLLRELFVLEAIPSLESPRWLLVSGSPRRADLIG
ncbi:MAG: hypothetical protein KDB23_31780, partial [Planctomycetales bacterium]|nr:hypothetical protein [Planctomycetales bacterium]